jgi:HSP20 family protein
MLSRRQARNGWVAPWFGDPFEDLGTFTELRRQMNRLIEDYDRDHGAHTPGFELSDNGEALELRAELPGFAQKDIEVELDKSVLSVRAKRSADAPEGYVAHRRERRALEIARAFQLPCRVDGERASATLENGVLRLTLPKVPKEEPRRLEVRAR